MLSDAARLVLLELAAPPRTPISSAELSDVLCGSLSPAQVGARLRELRTAGLAEPLDALTLRPLDLVQSGVRVVWRAR